MVVAMMFIPSPPLADSVIAPYSRAYSRWPPPSSKHRAVQPHPLNVGSIFREMDHCLIST